MNGVEQEMETKSPSKPFSIYEIELLPFSSSLRILMGFSFVAPRSMLSGFERFNREVYVLLHLIMPPKNKKSKKGKKTV